MTVSAIVRKAGPYAGNGITTAFPFTFKVTDAAFLLVTRKDAAGARYELVLSTNYSVVLNSDQDVAPGGTVTYPITGSPLPGGETLTISTDQPEEQQTDLTNGGGFFPTTIESALDTQTILTQQLAEKVSRTVRSPVVDTTVLSELPASALRAGKFMAFDALGQPVVSAGSGGGDTSLRADLANTGVGTAGAALIGYRRPESGSVAATLQAWLFRSVYVADFGNNTVPGTTDMTAAIQAANDAIAAVGGGKVIFAPERYKTTAELTRDLGVSWIGQGRAVTILEGAHEGVMVSTITPLPGDPFADGPGEDQFAMIDGFGFKPSGAFTPSIALKYQSVAFTRIHNCRIHIGIEIGIQGQFLLNSSFENINNEANIGTYFFSTSVADGCNLNTFKEVAFANNSACHFRIDGHGSYSNHFDTCAFFSAGALSLEHIYAAKTLFTNCTWEFNPANSVHLVGGDGITFHTCSFIDPGTFIDSATFGARNVVFEDCLEWNSTTATPTTLSRNEITVRDSSYTLDEADIPANYADAHYFTEAHNTSGRQFANFPSYATGHAFGANSHVTPYGGVITPVYNRVGSWNLSDGAQWPTAGTAGAIDPFGGATAYNMNTIASSQHGGFGLGAAATGRTFTFQVWAKFIGRVRLGIGTTNVGIVKRANFYSTTANWRLLSVTYTSGTDVGTTPLCNILTSQNTVMWRPCHYESFGPLPAIPANTDLTAIVQPMTVVDAAITTRANAVPPAGAWRVGDTQEQTVPIVGNPKRWRCTVAGVGAGATWVSEGNL